VDRSPSIKFELIKAPLRSISQIQGTVAHLSPQIVSGKDYLSYSLRRSDEKAGDLYWDGAAWLPSIKKNRVAVKKISDFIYGFKLEVQKDLEEKFPHGAYWLELLVTENHGGIAVRTDRIEINKLPLIEIEDIRVENKEWPLVQFRVTEFPGGDAITSAEVGLLRIPDIHSWEGKSWRRGALKSYPGRARKISSLAESKESMWLSDKNYAPLKNSKNSKPGSYAITVFVFNSKGERQGAADKRIELNWTEDQ
jgi:hypothetical protein